ncbi:MAG: SpvB/TcaC N-terminal domain-containing protein, partial [Desulfobacteraceae bacterium]
MRFNSYKVRFIFYLLAGIFWCPAFGEALAETPIPDAHVTAAAMLSYNVPEFAPLNGSVRHVIPLTVPPGRNGIQPKLSLTYDNTIENGLLGVGWKLELGEIRRRDKWGVEYNKDDYIAVIDDTAIELVKINANEYRAKIEKDFNKYFNHGTGGWEVIKRDGTRYFFGRSNASRMQDNNRIFKWGLDRVEDTNGNVRIIGYQNHSGQLYPVRMDYDFGNHIDFVWQNNRSDIFTDAKPGWLVETTRLLEKIETFGSGRKAKVYRLTYEHHPYNNQSRLKNFKECTADESSCLPAHVFTWHDGGKGTFRPGSDDLSLGFKHVEDINGDGLSDLVVVSSKNKAISTGIEHVDLTIRKSNGVGDFLPPYTTRLEGCHGKKFSGLKFIHLNKDAHVDIYAITKSGNENNTKINRFFFLNNRDGTFREEPDYLSPPSSVSLDLYSFSSDFNGDGLSDLSYNYYFNDIFKPDNIVVPPDNTIKGSSIVSISLANGDGTFKEPVQTNFNGEVGFGEFNNDGLTDAIQHRNGQDHIYYGNGDGTFQSKSDPDLFYAFRGKSLKTDLNGDRLIDSVRLFASDDRIQIISSLAKGDGTFHDLPLTYITCPGAEIHHTRAKFVELNGDGIRDLLVTTVTGREGNKTGHLYTFLSDTAPPPNLISTMANGYGAVTTVTYDYLKRTEKTFVPFSMH